MKELILVTGATGYVGSRLVPRLLQAGYRVRVLVRDPDRLRGRHWLGGVEVSSGDVLVAESLIQAMAGVSAAYYLVHSMTDTAQFSSRDRQAAATFSAAAGNAGVRRMIYLGGLGDPHSALSTHLRSRQETGEALRQAGVPVTEFRAAVIVGSGSASFEMIRYLTERLPVMLCPRWVSTRVQPIGIRNVLDYLVAALETPASAGRTLELGGKTVLTYGLMMLEYARIRGLNRRLISVPVLTPRLSSYWIHWVTPIPSQIAKPLIEGLRNEVIVHDDSALRLFPGIEPEDYETSVRRALARLEAGAVESRWTDSLATSQGDRAPVHLTNAEGMIREARQQPVRAPARAVFEVILSLGGDRGWLYANGLWRIRGWLDRLVGGVGLRRGRRDPLHLRVGDAVDFWRVETLEPDHLLRLRAEMKVPGKAWLEFVVKGEGEEMSRLQQTAYFAPRGLCGHLYWHLLYPIHAVIFSGLIRNLARISESQSHTSPSSSSPFRPS